MTDERTLEVMVRLAPRGGGGLVVDAAFRAPPGVTVLFGPSGAGKSTLLAAIAGLMRPSAGRVRLGDEVWFDGERRIDRPPQERGVSFVFQSLALFPHLTALGNVEYGIDRAVPRAERRRRAQLMLERMKVPHLARRRPRTFSGGEAQRVALARAFARRPKLVLLDEPFSALDRDLRRALVADVRAMIAEQQIPAILVTHQTAEARIMGDRVVLIEEGRIQGEGTLEELFEGTPLPDLSRTP
jgi:molybdate transport system ATP-binding protein